MNITGLDYNTQRDRLSMPAYGREVQRMVAYAVQLPRKSDRQRCAETIVRTMALMQPQARKNAEFRQKLWDHLALMSDFKLDIDWPVDVSGARTLLSRPAPLQYPHRDLRVRHYGQLVFELLDRLKSMPAGRQRDRLAAHTAGQRRRDLVLWSHGSAEAEKVADDIARFTDGRVQIDLDKFRRTKVTLREPDQPTQGKKRRRR